MSAATAAGPSAHEVLELARGIAPTTEYGGDGVHRLSQLVNVDDPQHRTSPGARFLGSLFAGWLSGLEYRLENLEGATVLEALADESWRDQLTSDELSSITVWTAERWSIFTDLCLWQEVHRLEEMTGETSVSTAELPEFAGVMLEVIGAELFRALFDRLDTLTGAHR